jgi:hypothetical protein
MIREISKYLFSSKLAHHNKRATNIIFASAAKQTQVEGQPWANIHDYSNISGLALKMCLQIEEEFRLNNIPFPLESMHDSCLERFMKDITLEKTSGDHGAVIIYLIGYAYQKYFLSLPDSIRKKLDSNEKIKPKVNEACKFDIDKILN